jgi:DNA-binding transcriptional regulator YiaG
MENKPSHTALADHIRARGIKKQDFASEIGARNDHLSRWLAGKVRPSGPTRMMLEIITKGEVKADGWP